MPRPAKMCEKCQEPIVGEVLQWQEDGGREWKRLCWPCKKPMMDAVIPGALAALKREFESPAVREAIGRMLSDDSKARN
jgi:hypothetical protein